ncbi:MAG: hypothetical protein ABSB11_06970 [Sedimentisphaerales bacterium]|jgi:hypothetical protein
MKYVMLFLGLLALAFITFIGFSVAVLFLSYHHHPQAGFAEDTLREINWSDPNLRGKLAVGKLIEADANCPFAQLQVGNPAGVKKTFAILTISDPCITAASYAITGQVRYSYVKDTGYLEIWNYFPDGKMYFSRTLGDSGPMQSLTGSSGWRPFTLPFYIDNTTKMRPVKLEFNVVLPSGIVYLGPLKLVQFKEVESAVTKTNTASNAWWTDRTGGLVGGIAGTAVGLTGAAIGVLAGIGIARKVCLSLLGAMFVLGIASLAVGLAALASSQPYAVYYPLLLLGLLCSVLPAGLFRSIKRQYELKELRKMHAMDIK